MTNFSATAWTSVVKGSHLSQDNRICPDDVFLFFPFNTLGSSLLPQP
ncbi:hypothetical protein [Scytonema sp. NUACC21]